MQNPETATPARKPARRTPAIPRARAAAPAPMFPSYTTAPVAVLIPYANNARTHSDD